MDEINTLEVEARYGGVLLPDEQDLIVESVKLYGEWAQHEVELLKPFYCDAKVIFDVGACFGTQALAFMNESTRAIVYAFEANPKNFEFLEKNTQYQSITAINQALGAKKETRSIINIEGNAGASQLQISQGSSSDSLLELKKLDDLSLPSPDFIKVDIEGMEVEFLEGAKGTISAYRPTMFLEANTLTHASKILSWSKAEGFTVFGILCNAFNPKNYKKNKVNIFGPAKEIGLLLIHSSHSEVIDTTTSMANFVPIKDEDDLFYLFLGKPQYINEHVFSKSRFQGFSTYFEEDQKMFDDWLGSFAQKYVDGSIIKKKHLELASPNTLTDLKSELQSILSDLDKAVWFPHFGKDKGINTTNNDDQQSHFIQQLLKLTSKVFEYVHALKEQNDINLTIFKQISTSLVEYLGDFQFKEFVDTDAKKITQDSKVVSNKMLAMFSDHCRVHLENIVQFAEEIDNKFEMKLTNNIDTCKAFATGDNVYPLDTVFDLFSTLLVDINQKLVSYLTKQETKVFNLVEQYELNIDVLNRNLQRKKSEIAHLNIELENAFSSVKKLTSQVELSKKKQENVLKTLQGLLSNKESTSRDKLLKEIDKVVSSLMKV
jgi:FkbM family methyltransferase